MQSGFLEEAAKWRSWLVRAVAGKPEKLQIMYGVAGERRLTEYEVPWLAGYEASAPVRVGNAAHGQRQLDVYGEDNDAFYAGRCLGLSPKRLELGAGVQAYRASRDHLGPSRTTEYGRCVVRSGTSPIPR